MFFSTFAIKKTFYHVLNCGGDEWQRFYLLYLPPQLGQAVKNHVSFASLCILKKEL